MRCRWQDNKLSFEECMAVIPEEMLAGADEVSDEEWECGTGILEGLRKAFEEKNFEAIGRSLEALEN